MRKVLLLLVLLIMISGCAVKRDPKVVQVGIIKVPNDSVIAIQNEWIHDAFAQLGYTVEFRFFDSGVAMNQAFASGSLDIAEMGYTNAVITAAKNLPVELFWIHDVIGSSEALVSKEGSIDTISDLKGKKVATVFASTSHFSLLKALELNGLHHHDVTLLNMSTAEIVAAWNRGELDATYSWEPTLSKVKETGEVLIDSAKLSDLGYMTTNVGLVHKNFAKNHTEALLTFIECLDKAYQLKQDNLQQVIEDAMAYLDIDFDTAQTQLEGSRWLSMEEQISEAYLGGGFQDVFYDTAAFWHDLDFINETLGKDTINLFVNPSYIKEVIKRDQN